MSTTVEPRAERPAPAASAPVGVPARAAWPESTLPAGPRPADPPLSPRTGQPRRPAALTLLCCAFAATTLFYGVEVVVTFWRIVHASGGATLLLRANHPPEMSIPLVLLAVLAVLHTAAVAALAAYTGFQAWNGWGRSRWTALGAVLLATLTFLVNADLLLGLVVLVPAAALLWLPAISRYNRLQHLFRYVRANPRSRASLPDYVPYGPLPRYRHLTDETA